MPTETSEQLAQKCELVIGPRGKTVYETPGGTYRRDSSKARNNGSWRMRCVHNRAGCPGTGTMRLEGSDHMITILRPHTCQHSYVQTEIWQLKEQLFELCRSDRYTPLREIFEECVRGNPVGDRVSYQELESSMRRHRRSKRHSTPPSPTSLPMLQDALLGLPEPVLLPDGSRCYFGVIGEGEEVSFKLDSSAQDAGEPPIPSKSAHSPKKRMASKGPSRKRVVKARAEYCQLPAKMTNADILRHVQLHLAPRIQDKRAAQLLLRAANAAMTDGGPNANDLFAPTGWTPVLSSATEGLNQMTEKAAAATSKLLELVQACNAEKERMRELNDAAEARLCDTTGRSAVALGEALEDVTMEIYDNHGPEVEISNTEVETTLESELQEQPDEWVEEEVTVSGTSSPQAPKADPDEQ